MQLPCLTWAFEALNFDKGFTRKRMSRYKMDVGRMFKNDASFGEEMELQFSTRT